MLFLCFRHTSLSVGSSPMIYEFTSPNAQNGQKMSAQGNALAATFHLLLEILENFWRFTYCFVTLKRK